MCLKMQHLSKKPTNNPKTGHSWEGYVEQANQPFGQHIELWHTCILSAIHDLLSPSEGHNRVRESTE